MKGSENGFKETELGPLPEDWNVVKLGEIAEIYDSKRIPLSEETRKSMKGSYPCLLYTSPSPRDS